MASVQLDIGFDEIESSCTKRTYDYFRNIHEEHLENPWWLCADISATISKRTLKKWSAHLLLVSIWLFGWLLALAFSGSLFVGGFYLIYELMGIAGVVVILLLSLVPSVIFSILQLKKEGRCPGHFNFLVKFCNSLQSFCESFGPWI